MKTPDFDRPEYGSDTSLSDTVFIAALGFFVLFLAAYLMIRPLAADANTKMRAEFILTMTWPDGATDDIDLWLMLPDGRRVNFRNRNVDYATLERDDLGGLSDIYYDASGQPQLTRINREMITIRALVPGRYVAAAHVYGERSSVNGGDKVFTADPPLPYDAVLEVVKLNPRVDQVIRSVVRLTDRGQQENFAAWDVDSDGKVTAVELRPSQYQIVEAAPAIPEEAAR